MKSFNKNTIKNWPSQTGVYLMMNRQGRVIYIGKAKNLKSRIQSYLTQAQGLKTQFLVHKIHKIDYILTPTESSALLLEASLVKKHKPRYNVRLKDDKAYPYIRLSIKDAFPRFYLERKARKDGHLYFGPYSGGATVRNMIRFLNENYQIRDCSDHFMKSRKTPCLTHQMGNCTAPCVKKTNYAGQIESALLFLKGKSLKEITKLKKQMQVYADKENFEQALKIKNRLDSIEEVLKKQDVVDDKAKKDQDVFAYSADSSALAFEVLHIRSGRWIGHSSYCQNLEQDYGKTFAEPVFSFLIQYYMENLIPDQILLDKNFSKKEIKQLQQALESLKKAPVKIKQALAGKDQRLINIAVQNAKEKLKRSRQKDQGLKKGLLEIQKKFGLKELPYRIECYDISHFQSFGVYGSQVVFENGEKKPEDYRLYKLKAKNDDYQSMKEVLSRRFSHPQWPAPQMILIDGGKGQLNSALHILKEIDEAPVSVVSIAKIKTRADFKNQNEKKFASLKDSGFGLLKNQKLNHSFSSVGDQNSSQSVCAKQKTIPSSSSVNQSQKKTGVQPRLREKFYIAGRKNPVFIDEARASFRILVQLRDEAHRFAITHHRRRFRKKTLQSSLDELQGIGEKRKQKLLQQFKTVKRIKKASASEVSACLKISQKSAQKLLQSLR